ncbi:SGNH/GDSL hydrolase family protein [Actinoplanes sp. CA-142083]|uniref:SGNH/GDSL hydrolase family protein n=1 Tax=Actinoplanes sp. CA-142083 TaxID=3239903 RepID=UPI003D8B2FFB
MFLLLALLLSACTPQAGFSSTLAVVTLGDSVPAGTACGCEPFPILYARAEHFVSLDLASSGATTADVRAAVPGQRDLLSSAASVIIMVGANDMAPSFEKPSEYGPISSAIQANVSAALNAIEQIHHVPVMVVGYWNVVLDGRVGAALYGPSGVRDAAAATASVNQALQAAATASGATYVSTLEAFHRGDPTGLLAPDGDHPNAAGHAEIAALLEGQHPADQSLPGHRAGDPVDRH